jgi:TPR repeat protein
MLAALVMACLSGGARAQSQDAAIELRTGITAYNKGDFPAALRHLQAAVDQGNAEALANLGYMYARGHGVKRDPAFALLLYRRGADAGDAEAMNAVGYRYNFAGPPDFERAAQWYCRAVLRGNPRAMNNLAILFYNGQGVPQDLQEARSLWRQSAALGHLNAQTNLGLSLASDQALPDAARQSGLAMLRDAALLGSLQAQGILRSRGYTGPLPAAVDMQLPMRLEPVNPPPGHSKACEALVS